MTILQLRELADNASKGIWAAAYWPLPQPHYWIGLRDESPVSSRLAGQVTGPIPRKEDADLIELAPQMAALLADAAELIDAAKGDLSEDWHARFEALDDPYGFRAKRFNPLADEDLTFVIEHEADSPSVKITVTHDPTGTTAEASGTDEQDVRQAALDDLLWQLENISG